MKTKINISIPEPCHENWQKMNPAEKGRFCDSCQKNVFDFTKSSDRQIIEAYNKNQNLCGRFLNTQLNRDLVKPKEKNTFWLATTSAVISFLALGTNESFAQGEPRLEQTEKKIIYENTTPNDSIKEKTITGIVTDPIDPLPGTNIIVKGTMNGVSADINGAFIIKAKEGDTLVFSFLGMKDEELIIGKSNYYKIAMVEDDKNISTGIIIGGYERRSFFGRLFHRIGNWFK